MTFKIFELGLIAVQNDFQIFQACPYCGANHFFQIFELGLIVVQNDFPNFRAWPYCGANRLGLIAVQHCKCDSLTNP